MKSVGEVMAIGRTFQESLQKALRGLEVGVDGFNLKTVDPDKIGDELAYPRAERLWYVADAFGIGMTLEEVHQHTKIDPWFLAQIKEIVDVELVLGAVVVAVTVEDPSERELPDIGLARFVDPETNETYEIDTSSQRVRADFEKQVNEQKDKRKHLLRRLALEPDLDVGVGALERGQREAGHGARANGGAKEGHQAPVPRERAGA